jgi:DNA-binding IclR family transcriptional regulator
MQRFAGVLKLTVTPSELTNPSKSAYVLEREMRNVGQTLGLKEGMVRRMLTTLTEWGYHGHSAVKAGQAFGPQPLPVPRHPGAASAFGRAADPALEEYQRQRAAP